MARILIYEEKNWIFVENRNFQNYCTIQQFLVQFNKFVYNSTNYCNNSTNSQKQKMRLFGRFSNIVDKKMSYKLVRSTTLKRVQNDEQPFVFILKPHYRSFQIQ